MAGAPVMLSGTEIEHRLVRGRQIVARQRELAARLGNALPVAVDLLAAYEKSLVLLENAYEQNLAIIDGKTVQASIAAVNHAQPATPDAEREYQEQMRDVARLMEILRDGAYQCELAKETMH